MHKKTPNAPPHDKAPPERESRRQQALFVDLTYRRHRPMYDPAVLLQIMFELRSRWMHLKPLAKTRPIEPPPVVQLELESLTAVCACCDRRGYMRVQTPNGPEWRCNYHVTESYPSEVRNRLAHRTISRLAGGQE